MAPKKDHGAQRRSLTSTEAADYTQGILFSLEKLAREHSHTLLSHLLEMARKEALWLSKK